MITKTLFKLSLVAGLWMSGLFASRLASAAETSATLDFWLWLHNLPDLLIVALVIVLFAGMSWLGLGIYHRLRSNASGGRNPRSQSYAAIAGGVLGVVVLMLAAGPWKTFLYDKIASLTPTAAGPPLVVLAENLLTEPAPKWANRQPEMPSGALVQRPGRARYAGINFEVLGADSLALNLFDNEPVFIALRTREVADIQGGSVWVGQIEDYEDSEVILAQKGDALMGTVSVDGRLFEIASMSGKTHVVREIDVSQIYPDHPPGVVEKLSEETRVDEESSSGVRTLSMVDRTISTGQVIDVLVAYTPNAQNNAGGVSGIESRVLYAVTATNQAYLNSKIDINLNLVHIMPTDYIETNSMEVTRSRLVSTTDGSMDEVHTFRDQYGADLVVLVSSDSNYCGLSMIMRTVSTDFAPSAFAVVRDGCLSAGSFAHEIGHLQGNEHDLDHAAGYDSSDHAGVHPDSYGYGICGKFRDIMSYSCAGEPRITYFSNPNIAYGGYPTGVVGVNDTARSMNATASVVANFRTGAKATGAPGANKPVMAATTATTAMTTVPTTPSNLVADTPTSSSVTLTWTGNSNDVTGYKVQRCTGDGWNEVAAFGQDITSYSNKSLTQGQTYCYRVYAYNSIGNSAYSNTCTATLTDLIPPVVTIKKPLPNATIGRSVNISVGATDKGGVSGLKLYIDNNLVYTTTTESSLVYTWDSSQVAAGSHTIRADAIDKSGNSGSSSVSVIKK